MIFVRKIDTNGFFIEDAFVDEITSDCIATPCPSGFYLPKWTGAEWVEGRTAAEITAIKNSVVIVPTLDERMTATESKVVDIETVIDTIFGGAE